MKVPIYANIPAAYYITFSFPCSCRFWSVHQVRRRVHYSTTLKTASDVHLYWINRVIDVYSILKTSIRKSESDPESGMSNKYSTKYTFLIPSPDIQFICRLFCQIYYELD